MRDEFVHRMTDEHVRMLDVVPEVLPNLVLRRTLHTDQVATDLDMRTVDDRHVRANTSDQRDQARHLRVICNEHTSM